MSSQRFERRLVPSVMSGQTMTTRSRCMITNCRFHGPAECDERGRKRVERRLNCDESRRRQLLSSSGGMAGQPKLWIRTLKLALRRRLPSQRASLHQRSSGVNSSLRMTKCHPERSEGSSCGDRASQDDPSLRAGWQVLLFSARRPHPLRETLQNCDPRIVRFPRG